MTCTEVIKQHLDDNASEWIPAPLLYSLSEKNNYSHADIKQSLSDIAHTHPYATWSVSEGDYYASREPGVTGKGVYYRKHDMTPAHLQRNKQALEALDAL
jgi:hypothetical protein